MGHVCFGEDAIELLIWACNYSQLALYSYIIPSFFSPAPTYLVIRSNYKPKLPTLIFTNSYSDMNSNETEAAEE